MSIAWNPGLATGNRQVDDQHVRLIQLFHDLREAIERLLAGNDPTISDAGFEFIHVEAALVGDDADEFIVHFHD